MEKSPKSYTFEEIKQKLIYYCSYQDRCHYEVEQKMREFLLIDEAKDELILYLLKENYLNEERFTRSYIRGKFSIKQWGRNKIRMHLRQKKITDKLISSCFDEIADDDYEKLILKLYSNYNESLKNLKAYQKHIKIVRYLMSRGFEYNIIEDVVKSEKD